MTISVLVVKTSDIKAQKTILAELKKRCFGKWLEIDLELRNHQYNIDSYSNIIVNDWNLRSDEKEFYFNIFSKNTGPIVLIQNFKYPYAKDFFKRWGVTPHYLIDEEVNECRYVRYKKVSREYYFSDGKDLVFYDPKASWMSTFYVWLHGRQSEQEVLWSLSNENKHRRNINKKNALSRQAFNWRATSSQWKTSFCSFLWRPRRREKTKEYSLRNWSSHFSRVITDAFDAAITKS